MTKSRTFDLFTFFAARGKKGSTAGKFGFFRKLCIFFALCSVITIGSPAQTFSTLVVFDGSNGGSPSWPAVLGSDGNFYGSTGFGGFDNLGTIYRMTPGGSLTTLTSAEYSHLSVQGTDGNFYGTTPYSGSMQVGSVFKMTPRGTLTTLHSFCTVPNCLDGDYPYGGVIQAFDGNFYGTTADGGTNNAGTIFKLTPAGKLTTLASFPSFGNSGTGVIQGSDGNFYGTTSQGGTNGDGTIFKVTRGGLLTTLYTFSGPDGSRPYDALIQGSDGNFYGTTIYGGANDAPLCQGLGCGTVFKMTPSGTLTTLYNFCSQTGCTDGQWPNGALVEGNDGNFYGTTYAGGVYEESCPFGLCGTIFRISRSGVLTTLHSLSTSDGSAPYAGLVQGTDGNFYGNTSMGGDLSCAGYGCGTIFSLTVGLPPFVEALPNFGKVGANVVIFGNKLTGATSVTFNGTAATFTVVSATKIKASVPTGATTGTVEVTTPKGILKSKGVFRVRP